METTKYLQNTDELIFYLITIEKYKKDVQFWLSHLNDYEKRLIV